MPIEIDDLLKLPDDSVSTLLEEFKLFWTRKKEFKKRGFTFKRGMLMWGPPGSGKTSGIWQMTEAIVKDNDGIVIFANEPSLTAACVAAARNIEPKRPMICVFEDIDAMVENNGEAGYLSLLDGETAVSNVVYVATTNYPERLDRRFVDRPSRFDTIMYVGMPSEAARRMYFKIKEPELDDETLERWVRKTDQYSVAHLREVIIAIKCLGQNESDVFARLNKMRDEVLKADDYKRGKVGF
jgi:SpoVK/Ycf46/Vps4 family AAA+-type ATPase